MGKVRQGPAIGARSKRVIYLLLFIYIIILLFIFIIIYCHLFIIIYCENFPRKSIGRLQKINRDLHYTFAVNFTTFTLSCNHVTSCINNLALSWFQNNVL